MALASSTTDCLRAFARLSVKAYVNASISPNNASIEPSVTSPRVLFSAELPA